MTAAELNAECDYIKQERLGILFGPLPAPPWAIALAERDALEFRKANEPFIIETINAVEQSLL
jgi:hypothetical protein